MLKSYRVWYDEDWCCLVLADSVSMAKTMFAGGFPTAFGSQGPVYGKDFEWIDIRVRREPRFDNYTKDLRLFDGSDGEPEEFWRQFNGDYG